MPMNLQHIQGVGKFGAGTPDGSPGMMQPIWEVRKSEE